MDTTQSEPVLAADHVSFSYANGLVLRDVSLRLTSGSMCGLVGPNGSGKTTLLRVMNGILRPQAGHAQLHGEDLRSLPRRQVARSVAMVAQETHMPFGFTTWEMVLLGRTPHVRPLRGVQATDLQVVHEAMERTDTLSLAQRVFGELSGGEQQRILIAMALAQEPEILLLDEPVVHLDVNHQLEIMELLSRLNRERGLTVLATMHDLNLAALYFDRLHMLNAGRIVASGTPTEVLREDLIREVFRANVQIQRHPTRSAPQVILLPLVA
jgi:iron complex transport system ATP-binding protein